MSRDKQNIKTTDWLTRGMTEAELAKKKEKAIKEAEAELRDKQIEEIAHDICHLDRTCDLCMTSFECKAMVYAKRFYDKGYRKASEVVRDIFNDLNEMWHKGRGFINYSDLVRLERLHEQKYEEGKP